MSAVAAPPLHPAIAVGEQVAGLDPRELIAEYGSPLFVYDLDVLSDRVGALRDALPAGVELAFAVKANPSLAVLGHLARLGLGADVASGGELDAALLAGVPRSRIVFTGPGKTDAELELALRVGIRAITVESLDEIESLVDLAPHARGRQGLLLRLAVGGTGEAAPAEDVAIIGGPGAAKFGLSPSEVDEAIDLLDRAAGRGGPFDLLGLHAFGASNVLGVDDWMGGIRNLAERAQEVATRHALPIRLLDGGGGLGIPYRDGQRPFDIDRFAGAMATEMSSWLGRPGLGDARLVLEPGRFLAGPMGAFVVRVTRTKPRGDRVIAIVDGGVHHLVRPALIGAEQRVVAVGRTRGDGTRPLVTVDVVGPLCTGLDVLATNVELPIPRHGDLLAVLDAGAYGFSESMPYFLSHPRPAEVVVRGGRVSLARPRVEPHELIASQRLGQA